MILILYRRTKYKIGGGIKDNKLVFAYFLDNL